MFKSGRKEERVFYRCIGKICTTSTYTCSVVVDLYVHTLCQVSGLVNLQNLELLLPPLSIHPPVPERERERERERE